MEEECINANLSSVTSGFDIPLFGVGMQCFYVIHVTAVVALSLSLISALTVLVLMCVKKRKKAFQNWHTYERFLIYRCICDVTYSIVHLSDHSQILITNRNVAPKGLCILYAILVFSISVSQNLFTLTSAISAFSVVYLQKKVNYGNRDWRLLVILFVSPIIIAMITFAFDVFGPNGFFCLFDLVKGRAATAVFIIGIGMLMIISLPILYVLTWRKIHEESKRLLENNINSSFARKASLNSAKIMCFFIIVYLVQYAPLIVYSMWQLLGGVSFYLYLLIVTTVNLGGVLTGTIYLMTQIRRNSQNASNSQVMDLSTYNTATNNPNN